ncbi:Nucleoporin GLE2 [Seminavis robusta]|uniref:Nucleoporin GLE2 n=1 Tax=Seminavis robusta TaxID=568900 RepID=A0A9N8ELU4_9STRA|nr:Nucleoporin GLE2 [Seminavis robusta]|eukprot:Sro1192_g251080.1 Nucleoporin GLE2 (357) ;mRNA; f:18204-19597
MSTFGSSGTAQASSIAPNDCNVAQAGDDGVSSLIWSPTQNILASTNWDSGVRVWEVAEQNGQVQANPKAKANHENQAPALASCFTPDGSKLISGGCDKAVRMWQLGQNLPANGSPQQIGVHDAPVSCLGYLPSTNIVVSGGWDRKLKFWDMRSPNPVGALDMPERVYDLDVRGNLMVVATAGRQIVSYDVSGEPREYSRKESPLKYQSRCISCFTDTTGFAVGSIEGRVGIHYLQKVAGKDSFAFKCHRQENQVYSVNAICFHSHFGTFATVGSDGVVNFWDKDNKQRLKGFNAIQRPIPCANFNAQGNLFAYASSYDWSKGSQSHMPGSPNEIFVHYTPEEEIKPKGKKSGGTRR